MLLESTFGCQDSPGTAAGTDFSRIARLSFSKRSLASDSPPVRPVLSPVTPDCDTSGLLGLFVLAAVGERAKKKEEGDRARR